jgi:hypothetical protein
MSSTRRLIENETMGMLADLAKPEVFASALGDLLRLSGEARLRIGRAAALRIASEFSRERRLRDVLQALDLTPTHLPKVAPRLLGFASVA